MVLCFNSTSETCPLCTLTVYCSSDAILRPFMAGTLRVRVCSETLPAKQTTRVHMASQDIRYSCWYVCESDLGHSLLTYNKAKRWTVPFSCWQCWKGYWGSKTPRHHGVSWESVDWNPYYLIGRAAMRLYSYLLFDYYFQQLHMNKVLHADTQLSTRINDCWSTYSFCRGWSDTIVYLQMKAAKMWTHWSQPFCCRPQGETLGVLDTLFWNTSERTQQQTLYLSPMVSYKKKGSGHSFALHPLGANTCGFSTCLVMSSVVQLLSDFVFTPYVLRQRHGVKVIPPPVTCVILMISKISSMFFTSAPIPTWFLSQQICISVSPNRSPRS
jgi:hypothetical protein